jgi:hypothetical protein
MNAISDGMQIIQIQLDRILASAVVLSWKDLVHLSQRGLIHIEYASGKSLPYLKIWELTGKGEWSLVCEYWMSPGSTGAPVDRMTFSNNYHSAGLAAMLEVIMQHQEYFAASVVTGAGLVQVRLPTELENLAAAGCMRHAYDSLGLAFAQIPAAAMA